MMVREHRGLEVLMQLRICWRRKRSVNRMLKVEMVEVAWILLSTQGYDYGERVAGEEGGKDL